MCLREFTPVASHLSYTDHPTAHMTQSVSDRMDRKERAVELTDGERHQLLEVRRRRVTLDCLTNRSAAVPLRELAEDVADRSAAVDADDDGAVERIAVSLHHVHLPKIADAGIVDYDPEANRVDPDRGGAD